MNKCPYWDCGYCYAPDEVEDSNRDSLTSGCNGSTNCNHYQEVICKDSNDD